MVEFQDEFWAMLETDPRMVGFWKKLEQARMPKEKGLEFLDRVWLACASEEFEPNHLRQYRTNIDIEESLRRQMGEYLTRHGCLPPGFSAPAPSSRHDALASRGFSDFTHPSASPKKVAEVPVTMAHLPPLHTKGRCKSQAGWGAINPPGFFVPAGHRLT